jgi:NAD(P)-dependent dehydrogenase (short-subunit alcohol dehydrogenase family)
VARLAPGGDRDILAVPTDVARPDDVESLKETVYATFGEVGLLMNNAATRGAAVPWGASRTGRTP